MSDQTACAEWLAGGDAAELMGSSNRVPGEPPNWESGRIRRTGRLRDGWARLCIETAVGDSRSSQLSGIQVAGTGEQLLGNVRLLITGRARRLS